MNIQSTESIARTSQRLANGDESVEALIEAAKTRIAYLNPAYHAFSHLASNVESQAAVLQHELDSGKPRSPIHGLTVSIKGIIPVAGLPWTEGSAIHAGRVAMSDARIVSRVRAAGGVVLGTTTLPEFAMHSLVNRFEPMGLNPWDTKRTAGTSSTGAGVAAALGMSDVNIGTDSGGSIRNPACHCGVVGFMPSIGTISSEGVPNYAPSVSAVGLIGRSVGDVETAFQVLADVPASPEPNRRLLVFRSLIDSTCDDDTLLVFSEALKSISAGGFSLQETDLSGWLEGERAAALISLYEYRQFLSGIDLSLASDAIRARAGAAAQITANDVAVARAACATLRQNIAEALRREHAAAIVTPTSPFPAPRIGDDWTTVRGKTVLVDSHRNCFVRAANAINGCAITLPMGLYSSGVPAGLHLLAEAHHEPRLLAAARLVEAAMPDIPPPPPIRSRS